MSSSSECMAPWERCVGSPEPTSGSPNHPLLSISHILSTCQENTPEPVSPASPPFQPPHPNLCAFHNTTYPYVLKINSSLVAQLVKNSPAMQETPVQFLGWEDPWRRDRLPIPVFVGSSGGSDSKESACNEGDVGLTPGSG